jgi:hypothetical protein
MSSSSGQSGGLTNAAAQYTGFLANFDQGSGTGMAEQPFSLRFQQ